LLQPDLTAMQHKNWRFGVGTGKSRPESVNLLDEIISDSRLAAARHGL
jgi:hypothetical protein